MSTTDDDLDRHLGLRERKNRRTHRAIVRAATELTLASDYASATIPRIAERADVAPRTVSTRFPRKRDIFFEHLDDRVARAAQHLGSGDGDLLRRIEAWIADELAQPPLDPAILSLRRAAIRHDDELQALERQHRERARSTIADAVADAVPVSGSVDDAGPRILTNAVLAFLDIIDTDAIIRADLAASSETDG